MRRTLLLFAVAALAACHDQPQTLVKNAGPTVSSGPYIPVPTHGIEGFYTGSFVSAHGHDEEGDFDGNNRIFISVDSLDDLHLYGHSVFAGNLRPFSGNYTKSGKVYRANVKEPGDHPGDGRFEFTIDGDHQSLAGTWRANNAKAAVPLRQYALNQQTYRYDPNLALPAEVTSAELSVVDSVDEYEGVTKDVLKKNPSKVALVSADVENMYRGDLELLRNSIYARHGYIFKVSRVRLLFENFVPWYLPISTDVTGSLTELEKKNLALIKRYEGHASRYYTSFGR